MKSSTGFRTDDLVALLLLDFELPSLRKSVDLAQVIADGWKSRSIRHPVLAFVLDKTTPAVIENLLLRIPELLDIMERVRAGLGLTPIFNGKHGRDRKAVDPALQLAVELRHERVAHRVKRGMVTQAAWTTVQSQFGGIWPFMRSVLERVDASIAEIRQTGCLREVVPPPGAARREYAAFVSKDVQDLID